MYNINSFFVGQRARTLINAYLLFYYYLTLCTLHLRINYYIIILVLLGGESLQRDVIFWLCMAIVFFLAEAATTQLVSTWFAFGSIVTLIPAFLGANFTIQLFVFLVASIMFLFIIRPYAKSKLIKQKTPTNADKLVGETGAVTGEINNLLNTGRIHIMGLDWTARSQDSSIIECGKVVEVVKIEGVKLIVKLKD